MKENLTLAIALVACLVALACIVEHGTGKLADLARAMTGLVREAASMFGRKGK